MPNNTETATHTGNNALFLQVYTVLKEVKGPKANVATIIYEVNRGAFVATLLSIYNAGYF